MVFYRDKDLHLYVIVDAVEAIELYQFSFIPSLAIPHNTKSNKSIIFLKVFASISTQDYQSNLPTTGMVGRLDYQVSVVGFQMSSRSCTGQPRRTSRMQSQHHSLIKLEVQYESLDSNSPWPHGLASSSIFRHSLP